MLRIPLEPLARRHLFRIPTLDKARIRPTCCADENFSGFDFARKSFGHAQRSHTRRRTQIGSLFHLAAVEQMLFRFAQHRYRNYRRNAGWSSLVARQAHNLKAAGSNPAPATKFFSNERFPARPLVSAAILCARKDLPPKIAQRKIHAPQSRRKKIQRSSVVERSAVKE